MPVGYGAAAMDSEKFAPGTVVERRDLAHDLWVIKVRCEAELPFRPGQYATIGVPVDGKLIERPYSIVSSPEEPALELFIELVPEGELTPHLHPLDVGAPLVLRRKTKGLFLRGAPVEAEDHLFVATVTGIAPFTSLLRLLARRWRDGEWTTERRIVLLVGASRSFEFGYLEEMRALEAEVPWFDFIPTVSRPWEDPEWTGETGRVEDVLRKHADRLGIAPGSAGVYLCGHPEMIRNARGIMLRAGLDDKAIREEQYWPEGK
jgi:ferredoxin/flavodoxin---NADP+ reductase